MSCLPLDPQTTRASSRDDFIAYRPWYGVAPPEHEPDIALGDVGRFTAGGEWVRLGSMFETSSVVDLKGCETVEGLMGISRGVGGGTVLASEECVFDPFISRTTGWLALPREDMKESPRPRFSGVLILGSSFYG
jgi:hypothetical protein